MLLESKGSVRGHPGVRAEATTAKIAPPVITEYAVGAADEVSDFELWCGPASGRRACDVLRRDRRRLCSQGLVSRASGCAPLRGDPVPDAIPPARGPAFPRSPCSFVAAPSGALRPSDAVKLGPHHRFNTICIHAGQVPDPSTGAIVTPIYQTSTYVQDALGQHKGYEYARTRNPTRSALEANIAAIENGAAAFAFASGMAAEGAVMTLLQSGDHVIVTDNVYGGTYRLFERVLRKYQLDFTYVDTSDIAAIEAAIQPATRMLFIETPTNPILRLTDLEAACRLAHASGVTVVVDNTFASPCVQRPLDFGSDLVVHSTTKFLNGHSDSVGGIVVARHVDHIEWLRFVQNAEGAILGPMDAWLVLRGTKTLPIRMERHNANAVVLADYLASHPKVVRVHYPGLASHPQHALATRQMRGFGGLISFELGSFERARTLLNNVRLMALAESLGGVETLISHPATMTHASVPPERRRLIGVTDDLVRLSVGIEDVDDLKDDLSQALDLV
jgi:cystathionine beta-lyase/cystathionine gamma-synthase